MEFRDNEPIYLQIASFVSDHILLKKWPLGEKIPSVRELAADLQVNPNTVVRAFEFLQQREVIANKRGIGFFIQPDAKTKIRAYSKKHFLEQELPEFFKTIYVLEISMEEIEQRFEAYQAEHFKKE